MEAILNPALLLFLSGILIGTLFKLILHNSISKYLGYYLLLSLGLKGGASLQENGFTYEEVKEIFMSSLNEIIGMNVKPFQYPRPLGVLNV